MVYDDAILPVCLARDFPSSSRLDHKGQRDVNCDKTGMIHDSLVVRATTCIRPHCALSCSCETVNLYILVQVQHEYWQYYQDCPE